jgi:drug/metabolite transporter (DMT)-like permease
MTTQKKTYLALVLITILWGNSFIAMKHAVQFLTPMELTILRFIPVAVAFAALLLPTRRVSFWAMARKEWLTLILLGLTGAVGYNIFVMTGSQRIAAGTTSLIVPSLNPIFTFLLSIIFLNHLPQGTPNGQESDRSDPRFHRTVHHRPLRQRRAHRL